MLVILVQGEEWDFVGRSEDEAWLYDLYELCDRVKIIIVKVIIIITASISLNKGDKILNKVNPTKCASL